MNPALAELEAKARPVIALARADGIAWLAYPKAGQLDTELNRDILWHHMLKKGVQGALRFRPKKSGR